jgi:hypothetical protein
MLTRARATVANGKCSYDSKVEEQRARVEATTEQVRILRAQLPTLLKTLGQIEDPRAPKKIKHKLTVLLIHGLLTFVYQMASRREANREMTRPVFIENLKLLFPDWETIPHHDTLERLLGRIDVSQIEAATVELVRRFIRKKKFRRYLVQQCYPIAIDGTQKLVRETADSEEWLQRRVGLPEEGQKQHYVYVLEANLAFHNGMTIPLMSEFLSHSGGDAGGKQDCELKAFRRLSERLKAAFSHLPVLLLLDGLYPNGPLLELCRKKNWDYMIVLQDDSLPSVWEEFGGLRHAGGGDSFDYLWNGREQHFEWVNDILYEYEDTARKALHVNLVVCRETWPEVNKVTGKVETKTSRHAWLSRRPLSRANVHARCNLGARHRWSGIESSILVEKCMGYHYEHRFAADWNAMMGYHHLMRLAHLLNELVEHSACLKPYICTLGFRGLIKFIRETITAPWLVPEEVRHRLGAPFTLTFIT